MRFRKNKPNDVRIEDEFPDVVARLRDERPEPTPLELDQMKMRALHRSRGPATTGASMRRTIVAVVASLSLVLSGTGAVIASKGSDKSKGKDPKSDDGKDKNAAKHQYTKCKTQKSNGSNQTNGKSGDSG